MLRISFSQTAARLSLPLLAHIWQLFGAQRQRREILYFPFPVFCLHSVLGSRWRKTVRDWCQQSCSAPRWYDFLFSSPVCINMLSTSPCFSTLYSFKKKENLYLLLDLKTKHFHTPIAMETDIGMWDSCLLIAIRRHVIVHCCCLAPRFCPTPCDPADCSPPGSSGHEISRQEYWRGLSFPSPGDLPHPRIKPTSLALADGLFTTEPPGKPKLCINTMQNFSI